jgi:UDP-N-acetylmuramoyl-tripeptide--D-alanyl-D-alanine ligase
MAALWGEITAEEFLKGIKATLVFGNPKKPFAGLGTDSRVIRPGELFWALRGDRFDGHDFVNSAIERGAAGVVAQKNYLKAEWKRGEGRKKTDKVLSSGFGISNSGSEDLVVIAVDDTLQSLGDLAKWWRQQHRLRVVGITGSAGKTTTKEMTADILELGNKTLRNQGNLNNLIGLPLTLLQLDNQHRNAVLEMGMNHPGEIARLTEIADPDVGLITNVRMAHLEGLGDLEGVAMAKWELVENISDRGKVVLNGDDELLMKKRALFQKEVMTFGLGEKNDVRASGIKTHGREGISFDLHYQRSSWAVRLRLPGPHNVVNALAAAAASLCLNEPLEHIVEGLGRFRGMKGRFMVSLLPGGVVLVDDTYNANPSALQAALESLASLMDEGGRIIVGLGEMSELGDKTFAAHREAGRMVAALRPYLFLAIGEHAQEMIRAAVRAGMPNHNVRLVSNHDEMCRTILEEMREGDLVFLKASRKVGLENVAHGLISERC